MISSDMTDKVKMMADAYRLKKIIEEETIELEEDGVKILIGGDFKVKKVMLNNIENENLKDAMNKAIRKVQEMTVLKMKEIMDPRNI